MTKKERLLEAAKRALEQKISWYLLTELDDDLYEEVSSFVQYGVSRGRGRPARISEGVWFLLLVAEAVGS